MTNNLIESFLKYEEQRKTQKNPNEFQSVKSLQERNIIRRANRNATAGAGEALRPEIAGPEQGPPVSAMARPGDTRFGNFNSDGTVSGNTSVTAARAGVRTEPRAITPSTGDSVRDSVNAGNSMTVPYANTSVTNSDGANVSIIPTGGAAKQEPEDRPVDSGDSTSGARSLTLSGRNAARDEAGGPATPEQIEAGAGSGYSGGPDATRDRREADDTPPPATPTSSTGRTSATSTHTVASGDNLSTLAQKNNLSVRDIMAANPDITDPHKIRLGQTIRIPRSLAASDKKIYAGGVGAGGPTNESVQFSEAQMTQRPSTGAAGREALTLRNRPASAAARMLAPPVATPEPAPEQGPSVSAMARPGDTRFGNFNSNGTVRGSTVTGNATAARAGVRTEPEAIDPVRAAANAGLSMTTPGADMSVTNSGGDQVSIIPGRTSDGEPLRRGLQRGGQPMIGPEGKNTDTPAPPAPPATPARPNDGNNRVSAPSQATLNTRPGLRAGSASADTVKAFQRELGITADGVAGPQTRQAVMDFQRKHGLQVDGIIGDQTRMAFERSMANYRTESVQFSEAELAHFRSILEAMPVAPTAEGHGPNPTPKNKAEGGKGRGSLSEMKKK